MILWLQVYIIGCVITLKYQSDTKNFLFNWLVIRFDICVFELVVEFIVLGIVSYTEMASHQRNYLIY